MLPRSEPVQHAEATGEALQLATLRTIAGDEELGMREPLAHPGEGPQSACDVVNGRQVARG